MKKKLIIVALAVSLLPGCASLFSGNSDEIHINSVDRNADIYVNGRLVGRGNATQQVSRGQRHEIRVEKAGCQATTAQTGRSLDARTFVGCLLDFCILTVPVDLAIGGALKVSPTTYTLTPVCDEEPKQL